MSRHYIACMIERFERQNYEVLAPQFPVAFGDAARLRTLRARGQRRIDLGELGLFWPRRLRVAAAGVMPARIGPRRQLASRIAAPLVDTSRGRFRIRRSTLYGELDAADA